MNPEPPPLPVANEPTLSPDFQSKVFQRINRYNRRKQTTLNLLLFCSVVAVSFVVRRQNPRQEIEVAQGGRAESAAKGVTWLVNSQDHEGNWKSENWGGQSTFNDGISALATLALLNAPDPVPRDIMDKAITSLESSLSRQQSLPEQGPEFYNRILTLYALLEVQKQMPDPQRKRLLEESLARLLRSQQADGGWGYAARQPMGYTDSPDANSAVTWWICHLLEDNPTLNVPGAEYAVERGKNWLAARLNSTGHIAYRSEDGHIAGPDDALYWMSALLYPTMSTAKVETQDAYRDYFRLAASPDNRSFEQLQQQQRPSGEWQNSRDRWWRAGGKVYLTALSVLSQVPKERPGEAG